MARELTPQEEEDLFRKWVSKGLDSGPSDHDKIYSAIEKVYTLANLTPPKTIIVHSLSAMWYVAGYLHQQGKGTPCTPTQMQDLALQALRKADPSYDYPPITVTKYPSVSTCDGQGDAGFLSGLEGLKMTTEEPYDKEMAKLFAAGDQFIILGENTCGWLPFEHCCIVSERPILLKVDAGGLLHSNDGPCVAWADGTAFYAVHGIWVEGKYVLDHSLITPEVVLNEKNTEVRQALMLLAGSGEILKALGATIIDQDGKGLDERVLYKQPEGPNILEVVDHTPDPISAEANDMRKIGGRYHRVYHLLVPRETTSCLQAVSGMVRLPAALYAPGRET